MLGPIHEHMFKEFLITLLTFPEFGSEFDWFLLEIYRFGLEIDIVKCEGTPSLVDTTCLYPKYLLKLEITGCTSQYQMGAQCVHLRTT